MSLVRIGWLGRAHGVRGEIGVEGASLEPDELRRIGVFTWRGSKGETRPLTLAELRTTHRHLLAIFREVGDREGAALLTNGELLVESDQLPDPGPGIAYTFQLIGLRVETAEGRRLGTLKDILNTGANPVYVVDGERELLIPATPEVLEEVDLDAGVIRVELPKGLEELS